MLRAEVNEIEKIYKKENPQNLVSPWKGYYNKWLLKSNRKNRELTITLGLEREYHYRSCKC